MLRAIVTYELPMDEGDAARIIDAAREIGFPMLAVMVEVTADEYDEPAEGMSTEAIEGMALGEKIAELTGSLGVRKISARLLTEEEAHAHH